jgi:hypothetical protein
MPISSVSPSIASGATMSLRRRRDSGCFPVPIPVGPPREPPACPTKGRCGRGLVVIDPKRHHPRTLRRPREVDPGVDGMPTALEALAGGTGDVVTASSEPAAGTPRLAETRSGAIPRRHRRHGPEYGP